MKKILSLLLCGAILVGFTACEKKEKFDSTPKNNGHEYVDLGLSSGTLWATCNIGATSPEGYGDYFAWGETNTKSNFSWNSYKFISGSSNVTKYNYTDEKFILDLADDVASVKWGGDWRIPSTIEMMELLEECTWTETTLNGVNGFNVVGPNGKSLFLPSAGYYMFNSLDYAGENGAYWLSVPDTDEIMEAARLSWYSGGYPSCDFVARYIGKTIRAICSPYPL